MNEKVLLDPHFRRLDNIFYADDLRHLSALCDLLWARDEPMPDAAIDDVCDEVVAIICGRWRYGNVARFPRLRAIIEVGGSHPSPQDLNYAHCFKNSIRVLSCAPAFGPAVAEMGLGLALAAARQIPHTDAGIRAGSANWSHTEPSDTFTLYEKSVGFIGFGGLARCLQPLLAPFRCPIRAFDPWLTDAYLKSQNVEPASLEQVLGDCRFVFVLAVPSADNRALIDRVQLEKLRRDAVFVLLSRAHVVDFEALTDLLSAGRFRAAIDVYPQEPFPDTHRLCRLPNVVLSSHRAGAIDEALRRIGRLVTRDMEAILKGLPPQELQAAHPEFIRMRG